MYLARIKSSVYIDTMHSFAELNRDNDKGVRFQFPQGDGGLVICQAHAGHFVGVSGSGWSTDVRKYTGPLTKTVWLTACNRSAQGPLLLAQYTSIAMALFSSKTGQISLERELKLPPFLPTSTL